MKRSKRGLSVACLMLGSVMAFGVTGCNGTTGAEKGVLTVSAMETGYGGQWLLDAAREFETLHEDVEVKVELDAALENKVPSALQSSRNLSDIYMVTSVPWREWVGKGWIADLTSVYDTEVDKKDGSKIKVKDYMLDSINEKYYAQRNVNLDARPYALPWALVQVGIGYNEDMLLATEHTTAKEGKWAIGDTWTEPPESVSELLAYCTDLNARDIKPFVFTGKEQVWLQFVMHTWWAQWQGVTEPSDKVDASEGSFNDFWKYESAEVYKQSGMVKAVETFQSIFCDTSAKSFKNVYGEVGTYSTQDAERNFVTGNSAMIIGGSFLYNEMKDYLDLDKDGKDDYVFKMMPVPHLDEGVTDDSGNPIDMTYYSTEDVMFIPAKATNIDLAKEFLAFLCSEKHLENFTKCNGSIRPFKYNAAEIEGAEFSPFTQSVLDIYSNENIVKLFNYPTGAKATEISPVYYYYEPKMNGARLEADFTQDLREQTASSVMQRVYNDTSKEFPKWKQELGIE